MSSRDCWGRRKNQDGGRRRNSSTGWPAATVRIMKPASMGSGIGPLFQRSRNLCQVLRATSTTVPNHRVLTPLPKRASGRP